MVKEQRILELRRIISRRLENLKTMVKLGEQNTLNYRLGKNNVKHYIQELKELQNG